MTDDDRRLSEGLRHIADRMPPAQLSLDKATTPRAHSPWRAVTIAVAATIAAIAVPATTVIAIDRIGHRTAQPAASGLPSAPTLAAAAVPRTPTPQATVSFSLTRLPLGPRPKVPYFSNGEFYPAGGGTGVPGGDSHAAIARYGDGWITLDLTEGQDQIRIWDSTGRMVRTFPAYAPRFARGADGSVAVSMAPGQITLVDSQGVEQQTWTVPGAEVATPISVLPDHSVVLEAAGPRASNGSRETGTLRALPDGSLQAVTAEWPVTDVNQQTSDLAVTFISTGAGSSCSGVLASDPLSVRWVACPRGNGWFSPDGRYLAMVNVQTDNPATTWISVFDAQSGALVVRFSDPKPEIASIDGLVWEDDTHLLAKVSSNNLQTDYPIRFGVDGTVERVSLSDPHNTTSWVHGWTFEIPL